MIRVFYISKRSISLQENCKDLMIQFQRKCNINLRDIGEQSKIMRKIYQKIFIKK